MKPYYDEDGITIYHGDCLDVLPTVDFASVVTDPPYGTGLYKTDTTVFTPQLAKSLIEQYPTAVFGYPERMVGLCVAAGVVPDEWITWWPNNAAAKGFNLHGLWKEVEVIAVFGGHRFADARQDRAGKSQELVKTGYEGANRRIPLDKDAHATRRVGDVWTDPAPGIAFNSHQRLHPNEKPISIMLRLLDGVAVGTVVDPFMGSGTTLRAAKDLSRKAIGIEIEERYCEIAAKRLAQGVLDFGASA